MQLRILYLDGCPNHRPTVELVEGVAHQLGIEVPIDEAEVHGPEEARETRFLGSPTVQINGVDIEADARNRQDFGFCCRRYGEHGFPDGELIRQALLNALPELDRHC